jgi:hypothetical protein
MTLNTTNLGASSPLPEGGKSLLWGLVCQAFLSDQRIDERIFMAAPGVLLSD